MSCDHVRRTECVDEINRAVVWVVERQPMVSSLSGLDQ